MHQPPHNLDTVSTVVLSRRPRWRDLFAFTTREHWPALAGALIATILVAAVKTTFPIFLGHIFDIIAHYSRERKDNDDTLHLVSTWCVALVALAVVGCVAHTTFLVFWVLFGELQACAARRVVITTLITKEMSWFESKRQGCSGLFSRIQSQARELQSATSQLLGFLLCDIITSVTSLIVALYLSWKLTLVLLSTVPATLFIMSFIARGVDIAAEAQKTHLERASSSLAACIRGIDLVKVFGTHESEVRRYCSAVSRSAASYLTQAMYSSIQMGYVSFWVVSLFVVGFWYGATLVSQGLPPGDVVSTLYSTLAALQGVESLTHHCLVLLKGKNAGAFLSNTCSDLASSGSHVVSHLYPGSVNWLGDIELSDVHFSYPSNNPNYVIQGVSLRIRSGQMSFVIGKSGSGKSTISSLISNLHQPTEGDVFIAGQPLQKLRKSSIREHIVLIPQEAAIFNDTLYSNIALGGNGEHSPSRMQVMQACEFAMLQSTISGLPRGLDSLVGHGECTLSGGQKQKVALARAWLRNPPILILDEATNALDPESQDLIMAALRKLRRDKTTIIITHDTTCIEPDDFVHVLGKGELKESGYMRNLQFDPSNHLTTAKPSHVHTRETTSYYFGHTDLEYGENAPLRLAPTRRFPQQAWGLAESMESKQHQFSTYLDWRFVLSGERDKSSKEEEAGYTISGCLSEVDTCTADDQILGADQSRNTRRLGEELPNERQLHEETPKSCPGVVSLSLTQITSSIWPVLTRSERILLVLAFMACMVSAATTPLFSFCLSRLLGAIMDDTAHSTADVRWPIYLLVVAVVDGVSTAYGYYLAERTGQAWIDHIRELSLRSIAQRPKSWFSDGGRSSPLINLHFDKNAEEMRKILGKFLPMAINVATMLSASVIWATVSCWRLTLVVLAPTPLIFAAVNAYSVVGSKMERQSNKAAAGYWAIFAEPLSHIQFIKCFALEDYFLRKNCVGINAILRVGLTRALQIGPLFGLYQSIAAPLTALAFYFATVLLTTGNGPTAQTLLQVLNLLLFTIGASFDLLGGIPQLLEAKEAASDMLQFTVCGPSYESDKNDGTVALPPDVLPVCLKDLCFSFPDSPPCTDVIRRFSLSIDAGTCVALVGPSGSGKSTILSLILGLFSPLDTNSRQYSLFSANSKTIIPLRSKMGYVPQTPVLFPGTIEENIRYGLGGADRELRRDEIMRAAKASDIHDFIMSLPCGYQTVIGDGGQPLSGGQAQRINLARALARRPRLLVLDEPTSSLDADTAYSIRSTLSSLMQSHGNEDRCAIVMATHSKYMMEMADRIAVVKEGMKVEEGTFNELITRQGHLHALINIEV